MVLDEPWSLMGTNISWSVVVDNATECPPELTAAMHSAWVFKYLENLMCDECSSVVRLRYRNALDRVLARSASPVSLQIKVSILSIYACTSGVASP